MTEEYTRLLARPSLLREEIASRPERVSGIVIDEIQRIPALLDEVQLIMDSSSTPPPPSFAMSGSSARKLKRFQANLLGGRAFTFRLFPLTSHELGGLFSLHKAIQIGTIPSVFLDDSIDAARDTLRSYVGTYIREEIEAEVQVRRLDRFARVLTLAGFENGNVLNFSNIARETGTSYHTVKSYFQVLEDTLLGSFLYPYQKSERKRLSRHPKFYFFDMGVTRALTRRLTVPVEPRTPDFGRAFEHFMILETTGRRPAPRWIS
jgi:predicted AAA+ superfamily ATPase